MVVSKKKLMNSVILLFVIFVILVWLMSTIPIKRNDFLVIVSFMLSFILIIFGIVNDNKKISLNKVFWYFSLFFMLIAPLIQYITGYSVWHYYLDDSKFINLNLYIILFNLIYLIVYKTKTNKKSKPKKIKNNNYVISKRLCLIFILISIFSLLLSIKFIGFSNLFMRGSNSLSLEDATINSIITKVLRVLPVYSSAFSILYYKKEKKGLLYVFISIIITVLLNFPTSFSRYWIGTVYLGLFILILGEKLNFRSFDYSIILIFILVFPLFQTFKWNTLSDLLSGNAKVNGIVASYNNADFDAYSMFGRTIDYTNDTGVKLGKQLSGAAFFIIPRKIWSNKSISTGELVAKYQNQYFTNLSSPVIAEGYVDFSVFGIILYAIIVALICYYFDNKYWNDQQNEMIKIIYPFMFGLLIFTLRGSLHPAMVFIFIFYIPIIICFLFRFIFKSKKI